MCGLDSDMHIRNCLREEFIVRLRLGIFLVARYTQWFPIENHGKFSVLYLKLSETHRRHKVKDCRSQCPLPTSGSSPPFPVLVLPLSPNISLTLGNFRKFFSLLYTSPNLYKFPLPTIPILLPVWGHSPSSLKKIVLLCFIGCEIASHVKAQWSQCCHRETASPRCRD